MADLISMLAACGATEGEATDPFFENTVLLLHGDGTNGAQNNTFLDSSTNNFTITRNGNTTQGSFSPFSKPDGRFGAFFPATSSGTQQQITGTLSSAFGTSNFTVDFWLYFISAQSIAQILDMRSGGDGLLVQIYDNNRLEVATSAGTVIAAAAGTAVTPNTWVHVAVVREGTGSNQVALYINGSSVGTGTSSTNLVSATVSIGSRHTDASGTWNPLNGYLSNFRISNTNRTITVPTAPYTSDANTLLLTCQSNRFKDNSSNAIALTLSGTTPRITPFSPYPLTTAYDPAVNGGSGFFDGSGDFLNSSSTTALGSGDFTIDVWFYAAATMSFGTLFNTDAAGASSFSGIRLVTGNNNNTLLVAVGNAAIITASSAFNQFSWNHASVVRSGSTITLYQNGVSVGTATNTTNFSLTDYRIGDFGGGFTWNGYLANLRVVVGSAITPPSGGPTSQLTAVSGTSYLANFTNAGIFDNTAFNNLETVADAQIDTSVKKYGTGSIDFDETGDFLTLPPTIDVAFGTGNFTIELWARFAISTVGNGQGLFQLSNGYLNSQVRGPAVGADNTTGKWAIYHGTSSSTHGSLVPSIDTWYHVAYVRSSGTTKLYIDGTEIISVADTTNYTDTNFTVGGWFSTSFLLNGYIDDFRITKGIARYTAAFTPPTEAFPNIGT